MEEKKKLSKQTLLKALGLMGIRSVRGEDVTAFRAEEDGMEYEVWRVETEGGPLVLKREKANEIETYRAFFPEKRPMLPRFWAIRNAMGSASSCSNTSKAKP